MPKNVWLVLPDQLSTRLFVDTGIVDGLSSRLDGKLAVVAMPWLTRFDDDWMDDVLGSHGQVFVLEDHSPVGGLADALRRAQPGRSIVAFGVEGWPACGTPQEALRHHGLDGRSLADRISARLGARAGR